MDVINDADNIGMKIENENLKSSARNANKIFKISEITSFNLSIVSLWHRLFNRVFTLVL